MRKYQPVLAEAPQLPRRHTTHLHDSLALSRPLSLNNLQLLIALIMCLYDYYYCYYASTTTTATTTTTTAHTHRYRLKHQNNHNLLLLIALITCLNYLAMANGHGRAYHHIIKEVNTKEEHCCRGT